MEHDETTLPLPLANSSAQAAPAADPSAVETFGDFQLLEELGRGRLGTVYKARQKSLDRIVALKIVHAEALKSEEEVAQFRRAVDSAAQVQHPHIVRTYNWGEHQGRHFIVMAYVAGRSLEAMLADQALDLREAVHLIRLAAEGLHVAHQQGVLHAALHPGQILFGADGVLKVTDTGYFPAEAAWTDDARRQPYLAAEKLGLRHPNAKVYGVPLDAVSPRSDVFSLGAILYRLLCSNPPWEASEVQEDLALKRAQRLVAPSSLNPRANVGLDLICHECLRFSPKHRYYSAIELVADLVRWLNGLPVKQQPQSISRRVRHAISRIPRPQSISPLVLTIGLIPLLVQASISRTGYVEALADLERSGLPHPVYAEALHRVEEQLRWHPHDRELRVTRALALYRMENFGEARQLLLPNEDSDNRLNQSEVTLPGKVSWWRAEGDAHDSLDGNHGTFPNGASIAHSGLWNGRAFQFDGDDFVQVPHSPSLNPGAGSMTIEAWIYQTSIGHLANQSIPIISKAEGDFDVGWGLFGHHAHIGGLAQFNLDAEAGGESVGVRTTTSVPLYTWVHLAGVYDAEAGRMAIYLNGKLSNTETVRLGPINSSADVLIGKYRRFSFGGRDEYFVGLIDEAAYYNRALSASEIGALYAAGSTVVNPRSPLTDTSARERTLAWQIVEMCSVRMRDFPGLKKLLRLYIATGDEHFLSPRHRLRDSLSDRQAATLWVQWLVYASMSVDAETPDPHLPNPLWQQYTSQLASWHNDYPIKPLKDRLELIAPLMKVLEQGDPKYHLRATAALGSIVGAPGPLPDGRHRLGEIATHAIAAELDKTDPQWRSRETARFALEVLRLGQPVTPPARPVLPLVTPTAPPPVAAPTPPTSAQWPAITELFRPDFSTYKYQVELETGFGKITLDLLPEVAPAHVTRFLSLVQTGFYNDLEFHRVVPGFVIQAGHREGADEQISKLAPEFNDTPHRPGVLSMARSSAPDSATTQFFICLSRSPQLDRQYTVFGRTADASSLAVVHEIGTAAIGDNDRPNRPVFIKTARILQLKK